MEWESSLWAPWKMKSLKPMAQRQVQLHRMLGPNWIQIVALTLQSPPLQVMFGPLREYSLPLTRWLSPKQFSLPLIQSENKKQPHQLWLCSEEWLAPNLPHFWQKEGSCRARTGAGKEKRKRKKLHRSTERFQKPIFPKCSNSPASPTSGTRKTKSHKQVADDMQSKCGVG